MCAGGESSPDWRREVRGTVSAFSNRREQALDDSLLYRGAEYRVDLLPKAKPGLAADDSIAEQVIKAITNMARTGKIGDGKIFVINLEQAVRIRTGETGVEAV